MPTIGTAISNATEVPRHSTLAPSCLAILRIASRVDPYMGQSAPHLAAEVLGLIMRGQDSGHPAMAHLLHGKQECQLCDVSI